MKIVMLFYTFPREMKVGKLASRPEEARAVRISRVICSSTVLTGHTKEVWPVVEIEKIVVADWFVSG